jgi:hypothetical protein
MARAIVNTLLSPKAIEFYHKTRFRVRVATTVAGTLTGVVTSSFESGDTVDGTVLATGNFILIKNQTTSSENGIYIVQATGTPIRHTSFDTAEELSLAHIYVDLGAANIRTVWHQANTLTSLSDNQSWSTTFPTFSFTVPSGIYSVDIAACGGGGSGARGGQGSDGANSSGGGGGGGAGSPIINAPIIRVTPGEIITINVGRGGITNQVTNGGNTTFTTLSGIYTFPGGDSGGNGTAGVPGAAGTGYNIVVYESLISSPGGAGGDNGQNGVSIVGPVNLLGISLSSSGGPLGNTVNQLGGGGGGAGGYGSFGKGGDGGDGCDNTSDNDTPGDDGLTFGAGGGGGGGGGEAGSRVGSEGGFGGDGYAKVSW